MTNTPPDSNSLDEVTVYGSAWCGYSAHVVRQLKALGVPHSYIDVDADKEAEQRIASWNDGRAIRPTLEIDGEVFVNPGEMELFGELKRRGLLGRALSG